MSRLAPVAVGGPRYWTALCLASILGADFGDQVAHDLHMGHWIGVGPLAVLLALALAMHRRSSVAAGAFFWVSVVLLRTIATNIADFATHDLRLSQPILIGTLLLLLATFGRRATPFRIDGRFWLALFTAGTLGTVLGDDASDLVGLVPASSGLLLVTALGFVATARTDRMRPINYWPLVLLVRTAGTSIGDCLADKSGLGLDGSSAVIALLFLFCLSIGRTRMALAPV